MIEKGKSKPKPTHGGQRSGSGRPKQFEKPTTINFKCEESDKLAAKEKHGKQLNKMFIEWLKNLIK